MEYSKKSNTSPEAKNLIPDLPQNVQEIILNSLSRVVERMPLTIQGQRDVMTLVNPDCEASGQVWERCGRFEFYEVIPPGLGSFSEVMKVSIVAEHNIELPVEMTSPDEVEITIDVFFSARPLGAADTIEFSTKPLCQSARKLWDQIGSRAGLSETESLNDIVPGKYASRFGHFIVENGQHQHFIFNHMDLPRVKEAVFAVTRELAQF